MKRFEKPKHFKNNYNRKQVQRHFGFDPYGHGAPNQKRYSKAWIFQVLGKINPEKKAEVEALFVAHDANKLKKLKIKAERDAEWERTRPEREKAKAERDAEWERTRPEREKAKAEQERIYQEKIAEQKIKDAKTSKLVKAGKLKSISELKALGLRPKNKDKPDAHQDRYVSAVKGDVSTRLYRVSKTVPIRKPKIVPPTPLPLTTENIGLALHTINKGAKRRRDAAQGAYFRGNHGICHLQRDVKNHLYYLKSAVLSKAVDDGIATNEGCHKILGNYYSVWRIANFTFHEPSTRPERGIEIKDMGSWESSATPRGTLRIKDAEATLRAYLREGVETQEN